MTTTITARIDGRIARGLTRLAKEKDQSKSFLVQEALEDYLEEHSDYTEALRRLKDKNQKTYSIEETRNRLVYSIVFKEDAVRELERLSKNDSAKILAKIVDMLPNSAMKEKQLKGEFKGLRRMRVGDYRVIFAIE